METTTSDDQYNTQRGSCDSDEANTMVIQISSLSNWVYGMVVNLKCPVYLLFSIGSAHCIYELHCIAFVKNLGNSESGWLQSDRKFDVKCALWKQTVQQIFSNTKLTLHSLGDTSLNFDLEHKETRSRFSPR